MKIQSLRKYIGKVYSNLKIWYNLILFYFIIRLMIIFDKKISIFFFKEYEILKIRVTLLDLEPNLAHLTY